MLQTGIEALLSADQALEVALGVPRSDGFSGIFPVQMPQGAPLPSIVYTRIAGHEIDTLDGRGELKVSRIQFSAYANHYGEADAAAILAKEAFVGFRGKLPDAEETEVDQVMLVLETDSFDHTLKIYQVSFDVEIWFRNGS